jgi:hypothetical protein
MLWYLVSTYPWTVACALVLAAIVFNCIDDPDDHYTCNGCDRRSDCDCGDTRNATGGCGNTSCNRYDGYDSNGSSWCSR